MDADGVCTGCGLVLSDDAAIVSELNFNESPSGLSSVVGQFVSLSSGHRGLSASAKRGGAGGAAGGGLGGGGGGGGGGASNSGYGRDSREQTLAVGRKLLQQLCDALRLRSHHLEAAHRYFALAVQHNFIQGRRTRNVAAACLYIVCRREKTSHLLLDFADVLQTNLYVLGATLLKFLRVLHIALPIIDPSLYIHRFAAQLELNGSSDGAAQQPPPAVTSPSSQSATSSPPPSPAPPPAAPRASVHVVAMTALRLVGRMKRDWLQVGRRPSGICGACLLIACRLHGYRRSQREIVEVVRVCDATLRRRLLEFVRTSSAQMTLADFESVAAAPSAAGAAAAAGDAAESDNAAAAHDPPAFTRACEAETRRDVAVRRRCAELDAAGAGDIVSMTGAGAARIADTVGAPDLAQPLAPGLIEPPTLRCGAAAAARRLLSRVRAAGDGPVGRDSDEHGLAWHIPHKLVSTGPTALCPAAVQSGLR